MVARLAGIDIARLPVGVPSAALWEQILSAAWSSNRLPKLLEVARRDAPVNHPLDDAIREYWIRLSPALRVENGRFETPPPAWQVLEEHREQIERTLRGLCLIAARENGPDFRYRALGFLAGQRVVLTHESVMGQFQLPYATPGQTPGAGLKVWLAFADRHSAVPAVPVGESASGDVPVEGLVRAQVTRVENVGMTGVLALTLEVETEDEAAMPPSLPLAAEPPPDPVGRKVYVLGYPSLPESQTDDSAVTARIFGAASGVLRVQPGEIVSVDTPQATGKGLITHNCFTLDGNAGSPLVDLATGQVLGLHFGDKYDPGPRGLKAGQPYRCGPKFTSAPAHSTKEL